MSWSPAFNMSSFLLITFNLVLIEAQTNGRLLPQQEKNALKDIAEQLGKKDWDFDVNPCDGNGNWTTPIIDKQSMYVNNVTCNCSTPDGFCHVQTILLKGQDLQGVLPPSLVKLPYLKTIDFSRNYLSGTIPPEWASTKLEYMSVMLNQLSGPIPKYLGNMTTLIYMSLENNLFNGTVPKELGNMVNLQTLLLGFNNLIGPLPMELNKLTNLILLRLNDNNFTGKVPSFESLKNLQKLELQASGFEGPVSPRISVLTRLNELRISDLTGSASEFPPLENMTGLTRLVLRNCNISGKIPTYIANMPQLKILDLSFNRLEGQIPNLEGLNKLEFLYLTSNRLTGTIHNWIKSRDNSKYVTDLSYNNFNESSVQTTCPETLYDP